MPDDAPEDPVELLPEEDPPPDELPDPDPPELYPPDDPPDELPELPDPDELPPPDEEDEELPEFPVELVDGISIWVSGISSV